MDLYFANLAANSKTEFYILWRILVIPDIFIAMFLFMLSKSSGSNKNMYCGSRGQFPHISKQFSDTSWVSHNSAHFWHYLQIESDSTG